MPIKMATHWVFLVVVTAHLAQCNKEKPVENIIPIIYEPSWTYRCLPEEGCQRSVKPLPTNQSSFLAANEFQSLDVCRTVCGRFGGLWPRPVTAALSMQTVQMHPNYLRFDLIDVPAETRELLVEMSQLVGPNMLAECKGKVTKMVDTPVVVYVTVKTAVLELSSETDEQYMLDVQTKEGEIAVHINAGSIYGARHAFESLTQLVAADVPPYSDQHTCSLRIVSGAKIRDRPVYKYRGLVLDTSRHFIPMADIKRTVDGMAAAKMNVFHWHVTDSHSFPLESSRVPQFTRYGAYSSSEIYSEEEVRDFIKYARIRGVRVVIEIDAPAHSGNGWQWGREYGFGDLAVCVNAEQWRHLCIQPPCGQLNPANPTMYRVLKDLYRGIAETLLPPALLHMGGDEVFFGCWNSSQEITNYMKTKNYDINQEGFIKLWAEFHDKALQLWDEQLVEAGGQAGQPVLLWSSELTQANRIQRYLSPERYIIVVWEPITSPLLSQLIHLGYQAVSVPKDIWYLDHGFWGNTKYSNWRKMYAHTLPRDRNVLGGAVAMWSEYVDEQALDGRIWPRAAAVAERLWSDPTSGAYVAEPRLQRFRTRLIARSLTPDAMSPEWCTQHDSRCL